MSSIGLLCGLLLLWAFGVAALAASQGTAGRTAAPGGLAWLIGAGGLAGVFLATLWLRALSFAGIAFSIWTIALPILAATLALGLWAARRQRRSLHDAFRDARDTTWGALSGRSLERTSRILWCLLLAWLALRFALLFAETATRPLYPWDSWTQWATKARVWYEQGRIVPFARMDEWFAAGGLVYTDAGPHYPGTVGLIQVLACTFLGRWDDTLMNLPFWMLAVAFAIAVYGALRAMEFDALWALAGTWLVSSLPLANAHVALAGYADLPLAMYFCVAMLAFVRWLKSREPADGALALLLLAACPLFKIPGRIWAFLAVPALLVGLLPRRGLRIVGAGYVIAALGLLLLAQTDPLLMGYRLHLDFAPDWEALANSFLLYDNWHLLWYGAVAVALLGYRQLLAPQVAPLTAVVAGGVMFLAFVLMFTNAREWVSDQTTVNRASLHLAPLIVIWMLVVFRAWMLSLSASASTPDAIEPPTDTIAAVATDPPTDVAPAAPRERGTRRDTAGSAGRALMLHLPGVTLVCVDTANHALAVRALAQSCAGIRFARALFLTDRVPDGVNVPDGVEAVAIAPIVSREAYSNFVLKDLLAFVDTEHVLVVQWDGYAVNPGAWDAAYADCDYLGAKWSWHKDAMRVGNGGFSLRSRRLLLALQDPRIELVDAEDTTICRTFRPLLEREHGIRFGSEALADKFAFEAAYPIGKPFGFHGLFNFWQVMPAAELAGLVSQFSDEIAHAVQLFQLLNNCLNASQWAPAIAIARRIVAADPARDDIRALLAHAETSAARSVGVGRNDPCPCGSGKRYKQCHGAVGTADVSSRASASAPAPSTDALVAQAMQAHQRGDIASAERDYRAALATAPDHPTAMHYLGVIHYQRNRLGDALPLLERAVVLVPEEPEFHNNLGLALAAADRTDEAIAQFRQALALKPDLATGWNNLGLGLQAANELPDAIAAFREALHAAPDFAQARWNLALALLISGDYAEGWREYEWRHRAQTFGAAATSPAPRWQGETLAGRTLLLSAEQGLGDALQFVRLAAPLAARGARVIVRAPDALYEILASAPGVAQVLRGGDALPTHDFQLPLLSVAGMLDVDERAIPATVPYLSPSRSDVEALAAAIAAVPGMLRVGLSWAGNTRHVNDRRRSCPLAALAPLLELPDIAWFSLQKIDGEDQIAQVPAARRIQLLDARNDFAQKAALIECLDLVISVDTSSAHLAGALGKPVWILLPFAPDWRWMLGRTDSPWYPTARLFRQPRAGDWAAVVAEVRAALVTRSKGI